MWNPFKKYSEIDVRLKEFFVWKTETKGIAVALDHKEVIVKFIMNSHLTSMDEATIDHIYQFKDWVLDHYASDYMVEKHMHSIRCFLRFCRRYDIIFEMTKLGRKPNYMAIAEVKELRSKKKTYGEIMKIFKADGRKIHKTQISRWANKILK